MFFKIKSNFFLFLLVCLLLTPFLSQGQLNSFNYWDILPTEPRIRWNPSQNPHLLTDWQVQYEVTPFSLKLGGVTIDLEGGMWQRIPVRGDCQTIQSSLIWDQSYLKNCSHNSSNKQVQSPQVYLNNQHVGLTGTILLEPGAPLEAKFIFPNYNKILTASLKAPHVQAVDISFIQNKWYILFQNQNFKPADLGFFDPTFPFKEKLFSVSLNKEQSYFPLRGFLGITYGRVFTPPQVQEARVFSQRPQIQVKRDLITYGKKIQIPVRSPLNQKNPIENWETPELKKNQWNEVQHNYLGSQVSYYALRMPQYEASLRFSIVKPGTSNTIVPNGEFAILGHSENLISKEYDHWLTHRLGWRIRGWQALDTSDPLYNLQITQAEVRFLIKKGVWNIEETMGLLIGGYEYKYSNLPITQPGIGFFWGRGLPNFFDQLLRWSSLFQYPKYTDLDFTYIPAHHPLADINYIMNFHGKMFFPNSTFIEAGVSLYQFSHFETLTQTKRTVSAFSGTVGFGYMF